MDAAVFDVPRTFGSAAEALHWADPFALDPKLKDQLLKIQRRQVEQPTKGGPSIRELDDLAHTISVELCRLIEVQQVSWAAGNLFRYVYGQRRNEDELADILTGLAWRGPGTGSVSRRKTREQCLELARAMMYGYRGSAAFAKPCLSNGKLAKRLGWTREHLRDQWGLEQKTIERDLARYVRAADEVFDARLRVMGIVE